MSEINMISPVNVSKENAEKKVEDLEQDNKLEKSESGSRNDTVLKLVKEADESSIEKHETEILDGKENSVESEKEKEESDLKNKDERNLVGKCEITDSMNIDKASELPKAEAVDLKISEENNKKEDLERKGTGSGDVKIGMAEKSSIPKGPIVITTAPSPTGPPKPKAKLERRKSLNPRVMTPPGLEVLDNLPMLVIRQQMDMDIQGGCGSPNTYKVWDENDEQIFFATEESGCLCRWACGPARRFSLDIFSASDDQVLNFHRTCCRCDCCCCLDCFMCLQKLYVVDCLGRTVGAVKQKFSVFNAKFDIVDHDNNVLFKVLGPCCPCRCSTEIYFQILNKTGERQIGRIQKKWGGDRTDSINVDHEYFDVTFPAKLDSVDKGLILGAAFLVNCMYLEMS